MFAESTDEEQIIDRVAALDIGKAELVCCVRVPASGGSKRRVQEVTTHTTMTRSLAELANRLVDLRVERVVMEATSDYWKPVFYLLEAHGLDPWLVNARDVRFIDGYFSKPGRTSLNALLKDHDRERDHFIEVRVAQDPRNCRCPLALDHGAA